MPRHDGNTRHLTRNARKRLWAARRRKAQTLRLKTAIRPASR